MNVIEYVYESDITLSFGIKADIRIIKYFFII